LYILIANLRLFSSAILSIYLKNTKTGGESQLTINSEQLTKERGNRAMSKEQGTESKGKILE
jgi:hypothetical protein